MADITIDDAAYGTSYFTNNRGGPFGRALSLVMLFM